MITQKYSKNIKYIKVKNYRIPVWKFGNPKNPALVFIHGFPCPFSDFGEDTPIKKLLKKYYIIAFDLPEFGYCRHVNMDIISFINSVVKKTTKGRKHSIFGISFGGIVALKYAYTYPADINGVIVCGTPFFPVYPSILVKAINFIVKYFNKRFHKILNYFMFLNKANLSKIQSPVLLLYSSKDKVAHLSMGRNLEKLIPNAHLIRANDRGHSALLDKFHRCRFMSALYLFLKNYSY